MGARGAVPAGHRDYRRKILRPGKLFVAAGVQEGQQAARGACEPRIKETVMKRKLFVAGMALIDQAFGICVEARGTR
jgi:hypothetical protein